MADPEPTAEFEDLARAMAEAWPRARARWSSFVLLAPPVFEGEQESVARIHLGTRQIELNAARILERGLTGSVEAILAHEVGHHVRYPGSLAVDARLRLIERSLIPMEGVSLLNLFTDLLINEQLGPDLREPLAARLPRLRGVDALADRTRASRSTWPSTRSCGACPPAT